MLDKNIENLSPEESTNDNITEQSEEKLLPKSNKENKEKPVKENSVEGEFLKGEVKPEIENEENVSGKEESGSGENIDVKVEYVENEVEVDDKEKSEKKKVEKSKPVVTVEVDEENIDADEKDEDKSDSQKSEKKTVEKSKPVVTAEVDEENIDSDEKDGDKSDSGKVKVKEDIKDIDKNDALEEESSPEEILEKKIPTIDYTKLTMDEIVVMMQQLIQDFPIHKIKVAFESLRSNFDKKYKSFISAKKEEFIKEGGNEIDFKFYLPIKTIFNDALREFKKMRQRHYKDIEAEQKGNLERKLTLIDDLKELIDTAEPSTMYKKFRSLQDEWRTIGQIPHTKYNDVWRTYHHHVERFYDLLHLNNDFRDLDFKHNLEEKTKLIERVEKLGDDPDVNNAFKELQIIHRIWKEDFGPVGRDVREKVWNRFSEATKKIHNKRHEFQSELESKFKENVGLKLAIVEKIKSIDTSGYNSHKLWQNGIREMENLRKEFFAVGRVPRSKNEEVWQVFKDTTRNFNKGKNTFYKSIKKDQSDNLTKKMHLIEQAESLKESDDWEMTTEVFKKIQGDWKNIGHVPRRDSDRIWKRFKEACNHYFDQLHNMQDDHNKDQVEVFTKKKELLERFKEDTDQEDKLDLVLVNKYISEWRGLGIVPVNMRHIESKFNKAIDNACKKLNINKEETALLKFKIVINGYLEQKNFRKLDNEQLFIKRKVDELTKEIKQLENNISFISNASNDNPLVKNVYKNIETYGKDLKIWERKLTYIRQLDY